MLTAAALAQFLRDTPTWLHGATLRRLTPCELLLADSIEVQKVHGLVGALVNIELLRRHGFAWANSLTRLHARLKQRRLKRLACRPIRPPGHAPRSRAG